MRLLLALLMAGHLVRPPGATNPAVRQSTVHTTICARGWSSGTRPPYTWSEPLKRRWARSEGIHSLATVQLDHEVPLELGGAPMDLRNLWLEDITEAHQKDRVENAAHRAVCSGKMPLRQAQRAMIKDWRALGRTLHVDTAP